MDSFYDLENIDKAAAQFLESIDSASVLAFHGEMGAGKTTFIKAVCKQLGVTDAISSPTYSIINQYRTAEGKTVYHLDLYRLKDQSELIEAGILDTLDSGNLCLIEWPALAKPFLGNDVLNVDIELGQNGNRTVTLHRV